MKKGKRKGESEDEDEEGDDEDEDDGVLDGAESLGSDAESEAPRQELHLD